MPFSRSATFETISEENKKLVRNMQPQAQFVFQQNADDPESGAAQGERIAEPVGFSPAAKKPTN